jgi:DNA replication protein DnaD
VPEKKQKKEEAKPQPPPVVTEEELAKAVGYVPPGAKEKRELPEGILIEGLEEVSTKELFDMLNKLYNAMSRLAEAKLPEDVLEELVYKMLETETLIKNEIYIRQITSRERKEKIQTPPEEEKIT